VEHPSLARLEGKHFLNDLAKRVYVSNKTSLKLNKFIMVQKLNQGS
jgi:hypothetical protein